MTLSEAIACIQQPDELSMCAASAHWDSLAKLPHSLGRLEALVVQLAGIQRTASPILDKRLVLVLCADNGVTAESVTPSSPWITAAQAVNFAKGGGVVNAFARFARADVHPVDIGIATPYDPAAGVWNRHLAAGTDNIATGPAMSRTLCLSAIETGIQLAYEACRDGYTLILTGEMGIGNTTTSSAVASVLLGVPPEEAAARGAGGTALQRHKASVIRQAIDCNHPNPSDPLDTLTKLGGLDLAALCGVFIGCAAAGVAVMVDGLISAAAALCAARLSPVAVSYMLPSHCSAEVLAAKILKELDLSPIIHADLCLGEGTGGLLCLSILDQALAAYHETIPLEALEEWH